MTIHPLIHPGAGRAHVCHHILSPGWRVGWQYQHQLIIGFLQFLQLLQNTLQPFRKHWIEDSLSGIRIISNIQFKSCHVFLISPKVTFGSVRRKKQTNTLDTFVGRIWWKILTLDETTKNYFWTTEKLYFGSLIIFV